jgi:glycosyltransferase involved in cell wall biosynthesis
LNSSIVPIDRILYLAAHGGFAGQAVPLGGGAAVANLLAEEWARTRPCEIELLGPAILGPSAPTARDIVGFDERRYASFCHAFREASTAAALRHDPARTAVLVNDISEGPDFAALHGAGFRVVTVYHVDVVAYIASIYLHGWLSPRTLARVWERLGLAHIAPAILRLIFEQQRASLLNSSRVVVPSAEMKSILLDAYPATPSGRIEVLPWGCTPSPVDEGDAEEEAARLRAELAVEPDAHVLLCLSRISPEKGQDFLLEALAEWERHAAFPARPVWLFICGEPAFMQGQGYARRLRTLAARLHRVRVVFPGYVSGLRKRGFLSLADLYLFPSSHESYGLTLVEALGAGLPAICRDHSGARQIQRPEYGIKVDGNGALARAAFAAAIGDLLADAPRRASMSTAARRWAATHPFSAGAATLARWLTGQVAG